MLAEFRTMIIGAKLKQLNNALEKEIVERKRTASDLVTGWHHFL
jgi:hypothetical protein